MELRLARIEDAEQIRTIYNREVVGSTVTFDLRGRTLVEQQRWITDRTGAHAAIVALQDERVIGFGSLSPYRSRPAYSTTVEDSVYVEPGHQGRGVGRALLVELLRLATAHGFHAVMARIVGGHDASIALHRACGFAVVGTEREIGRKFNRWLDVVVMQRLLSEVPEPST